MDVGNIFHLNVLDILHMSNMINILGFTPIFLIAGFVDYKKHEVPGQLCIVISLLLVVHSVICSGSPWAIILVLFCLFFIFGPIEFATFGQADFLILAHFVTGCTLTSTGMTLVVLSGMIWLVCLSIFLFFYRDENGKCWRPCRGMMVPALPAYSAAVVVASILRMFVTDILFFAGY